jgi:hypothetical protein
MEKMEISKQAAESAPARIEQPRSREANPRLVEWESMAERACAKNTRQAGWWKSWRMPIQYGEKKFTARGAIAAASQGRCK